MSKSQAANKPADVKTRKVSIQERSALVGDIIVVNGHRVNLALLKQRFTEGGYQAQETPHFLLFTRQQAPATILVHWFDPEKIDADVKHYVVQELQPLGLLPDAQHFGEILGGIVGSFYPEDARKAWRYFGANTLQRFLLFLSTVTPPPFPDYTTIGSFAIQYQRVCELCVGRSFLDAGCESGFLPLLISERIPFMERVVGVDIRPDLFEVVQELALERHLPQVSYIQADLLADTFATLGRFDTVVALGVIEHFTEEEMHRVLRNLLAVTRHRLILTVPYEDEPSALYGHRQQFTRTTLKALGEWCLHHLGGGKIWCEDCVGGLLLIDRGSYPS